MQIPVRPRVIIRSCRSYDPAVIEPIVSEGLSELELKPVEHLRLVEEHGFGTTDLSSIQITGDLTLKEAQQRAAGFEVGQARPVLPTQRSTSFE